MKYNPPAGSQDPDAKYVTGQPGKVRGSAVPAEAVEHPQREIVEVIKKAGLDPDGDDLTQLWQAIGQIISTKAPIATKKKPGLVQIGDGLAITPEGLLSVLIASTSQAGLVKPRYGLKIGKDGSLDVDFGDMPTDKFEELLKSIRVPIWLTKSLTVYVATTGSDTLDDGRGLTPDKPFASIQAAVNYVSTTYNLYKYNATISVAPGNYGREHILLPSYTTSTGKLIIKGSGAARTDVVCGRFVSSYASIYEIYNLTIFQKDVTSGTVGSVEASAGQIDLYNVQVNFAGIQQGTGQLWGIFVYGSGVVRVWSTASADIPNGLFFNCAGADPYGLIIASGSRFEFAADITVTGDAAWKSCAVLAQQAGVVSRSLSAAANPGRRPNVNTEGTITGRRYTANLNGLVNVAGAGPDFWPGNTEGNVSSGGQYA